MVGVHASFYGTLRTNPGYQGVMTAWYWIPADVSLFRADVQGLHIVQDPACTVM